MMNDEFHSHATIYYKKPLEFDYSGGFFIYICRVNEHGGTERTELK